MAYCAHSYFRVSHVFLVAGRKLSSTSFEKYIMSHTGVGKTYRFGVGRVWTTQQIYCVALETILVFLDSPALER